MFLVHAGSPAMIPPAKLLFSRSTGIGFYSALFSHSGNGPSDLAAGADVRAAGAVAWSFSRLSLWDITTVLLFCSLFSVVNLTTRMCFRDCSWSSVWKGCIVSFQGVLYVQLLAFFLCSSTFWSVFPCCKFSPQTIRGQDLVILQHWLFSLGSRGRGPARMDLSLLFQHALIVLHFFALFPL